MKKNTFIGGAIVATLGIVITKVIGLIYVVPFNAIIGEQGGALYGYAYNIYQLFLSLSSAGFPFAISKLTSEYMALGNKKAALDTYNISLKLILLISFIMFIILFVFAPQIGKIIIGSLEGGNTYSDVAFVIRVISFSVLIIPFLSVTKGFLQGNKYISPSSISQLIEQIVRVIIILVGSYLALKVFNLGLRNSIAIALSGAFFGGLVAYIYLKRKISKSKLLKLSKEEKAEDINKKEIIKKILSYSVPFIVISIVYNLYNTVDMILISRTMSDILQNSATKVESVLAVYTTWGAKLNNIILAVITGLSTSLIPHIVSNYTKNDIVKVNRDFNKAIKCILLSIIPITLFLSLLVDPVWTLFYGKSEIGPVVYKVFVFSAVFGGLYTIVINTLQGLSKYKLVIISVLLGLVTNTILDVPLMLLFNKLGLEAFYGAVVAAVIGYSLSLIFSFIILNKKYGFKFAETIKALPSYFISWVAFVLVILILKIFIPTDLEGRLVQIPILLVYGMLSFGIYFIINYLNGNLKDVFNFKFRKKEK